MQVQRFEEYLAEEQRLDGPAAQVQRAVNITLDRLPGSRRVRDLLHGTWLGHALHPAMTDIPIGAWTATLTLDLADLVTRSPYWARGADGTLVVGLLGAVGAAVTGLNDWSQTGGRARRVGMIHGLLNGTGTALYAGSLVARRRGRRGRSVLFSSVGYLCVLVSAQLGGALVFHLGTAVNRNAWRKESPEQFTTVTSEAELGDGRSMRVMVDGADILLVCRGSEVYALGQTCPYDGAPLADGRVDGNTIACAGDGSQFWLADGSVVHGPATIPLPRYEVRVRQGRVELRQIAA